MVEGRFTGGSVDDVRETKREWWCRGLLFFLKESDDVGDYNFGNFLRKFVFEYKEWLEDFVFVVFQETHLWKKTYLIFGSNTTSWPHAKNVITRVTTVISSSLSLSTSVLTIGTEKPQWLKELSADFGVQDAKDLRIKEWKTASLRTTPDPT